MKTRLILIRHGETAWNVEGRFQGQQNPPLNETGWNQARQLAEKVADVGLELLYSSELKRAYQTAEIVAGKLKIPLYKDARLNEIMQGEWETLLTTEIAERYKELFGLWDTAPWTVTIPGGENLEGVQKRVYEAVDEILSRHEGRCIGLVAHRIPIAMLKIRHQNMDKALVRKVHLPNTYWEEIPVAESREANALSQNAN